MENRKIGSGGNFFIRKVEKQMSIFKQKKTSILEINEEKIRKHKERLYNIRKFV